MVDYTSTELPPWEVHKESITNIFIDEGVTYLGNWAFYECKEVTSIEIPKSITSIGNWVFALCEGLTSIVIPNTVSSIGTNVFYDCINLNSAIISNKISTLDSFAFFNCSSLTSVLIPSSVTTINDFAFSKCSNLKDVYYGGIESDWQSITIENENTPLETVTFHYNSLYSLIHLNTVDGILETPSLATELNGKLSSLPTPTKDGYKFIGWYDSDANGVEITTETVFNDDATIFAYWKSNDIKTLTLNANGGTVSPNTLETDDQGKLSSLPTPTKDGYKFLGWYNGEVNGIEVTTESVFNNDVTIFAYWEVTSNSYTITLNANAGTVSPANLTTDSDGRLSNLPTPTRDGYIFSGWYYAGSIVTTNSVFTSNAEIVAKWVEDEATQNVFTISFNSNGGSAVSSMTTNSSGKLTSLPTTSRSGYTFVGWFNTTTNAQVSVSTEFTANTELIAVWNLNNSTGSSSNSGSSSGSYSSGYKGNQIFTNKDEDLDDTKDEVVDETTNDNTNDELTDTSTTVVPTISFIDTIGHWAESSINYVVNENLFYGTTDLEFSPDSSMTRGMFVTVVGRLENLDPSPYNISIFEDTEITQYFTPYINWAVDSGFVNGISNTEFAPKTDITREQMAVILYNYAKTIDLVLPTTSNKLTFADEASISEWAVDAIYAMQQAGILSGKAGNYFDPIGNATRAEVAVMIKNFKELV